LRTVIHRRELVSGTYLAGGAVPHRLIHGTAVALCASGPVCVNGRVRVTTVHAVFYRHSFRAAVADFCRVIPEAAFSGYEVRRRSDCPVALGAGCPVPKKVIRAAVASSVVAPAGAAGKGPCIIRSACMATIRTVVYRYSFGAALAGVCRAIPYTAFSGYKVCRRSGGSVTLDALETVPIIVNLTAIPI